MLQKLKDIRKKIRLELLLGVIKLINWVVAREQRRTTDLEVALFQNLDRSYSNINDVPESGADEAFDKLLWLAAQKCIVSDSYSGFKDHTFSFIEKKYDALSKKEKKEFKELYLQLNSMNMVDELRTQFLKSQIYYTEISLLKLDTFKSLVPNHTEETHKQKLKLFAFYKKLRATFPDADFFSDKTIKVAIKEYKSINKKLDASLRDKFAFKIDISMDGITPLFAILPVLFIAGAYFYCRYLFGHFGFSVENYFTINDYLSASIETLRAAMISTFFALGGALYSIWNMSRTTYYELDKVTKRDDRVRRFILYAVILSSLMIFISGELFFNNFYILFMLILIITIANLIPKFFNNPIKARIVLIFLGVFSLSLLVQASMRIEQIYDKVDSGDCVEIKLVKNFYPQFKKCDYVPVGSNSNFVFLINKNSSESLAIPRKFVEFHKEKHEKTFTDIPKFIGTISDYLRGFLGDVLGLKFPPRRHFP